LINKISTYIQKPLQGRLIHGFLWSLIGSVVSQFLGLATSIVTARLLGQVVFGQVGVIVSTIGMLGTFAGFGLGTTATKYIAELRFKDPERASRIVGLTTVVVYAVTLAVTFLTVVFSSFIATKILGAPELAMAIKISSLLLCFNSMAGVQSGILIGLEDFRAIAFINILRSVLTIGLGSYGAWKFGLIGVLVAMVIASGLAWLVNQIIVVLKCRKEGLQIYFHQIGSELNIIWKFSLPALLSSALFLPITWVGNIFLVNSQNGFAEMGIFNAANQWRTAIMFLPGVIGQTALPILSNLFGEEHFNSFRKVMLANILVVMVFSILIALPIIIFSKTIMNFYGASFVNGNFVLILISITAIFSSIAGMVGSVISSMGKMWVGFLLNAAWAIIFLGSVFFFNGKGAWGLSLAYLISYFIHFAMCIAYIGFVMKKQNINVSMPLEKEHSVAS
jgi:O-antigen/teichoic acid export membrane protein